MANAASSVTGQTGSTCPQSGPYRSTGEAMIVIFVKQSDTFPPDWDGSSTTWVLLTADASS